MGRKRAVMTFSGPRDGGPESLGHALARAHSARVTLDGCLVLPVEPGADVMADDTPKYVRLSRDGAVATTRDAADLDELRAALAIAELTGRMCMCAGDLAIEFLDAEKKPVEVIRFDRPDSVESTLWAGGARLADPGRLAAWLAGHGVTL